MDLLEASSSSIAHCYCNSDASDPHMIKCTICNKLFHTGCMKSGKPSDLVGDIYFKFTCEQCSTVGVELVERIKLQWTLVIIISLYNLQLQGGGKCGYFRWREHICHFIDKNWQTFFGVDKKKSATWHGTVAGALSSGANRFFISGLEMLGENGWWTLKSNKLPSLEEIQSIVLNIKLSRKRKSEVEVSPVIEGSRKKNLNIVEAAVALKEKKESVSDVHPRVAKPRKKSTKKSKEADVESFPRHPLKIVLPKLLMPDFSNERITSDLPPSNTIPKIIIKKERCISATFSEDAVSHWLKEEQDDEMDLNVESMEPLHYPDPLSNSESLDFLLQDVLSQVSCDAPIIKQELPGEESEEESSNSSRTVDTPKKMQHPDVSRKRKAVTKEENPIVIKKEIIAIEPKFTMMCTYEEEQLLKKLESFPHALQTNSVVRRLFRKLMVRKLKREKNVPIFNIDAEVRAIRGMDPPEYSMEKEDPNVDTGALTKMSHILDRFQVGHHNVRGNSLLHTSFVTRLMGLEDDQLESIVSPYTARVLKPFIYRDYETKPLKLCLLDEIVAHSHRKDPSWKPPQRSPIDYCYVRPQHIPGVNALCQEFFWPGIDLSESLQYPDFSCVALYKKIIIGFAFMVPDVKYNEAYISFIFCHPEWRRAGIATFMLYHLIQTCMGKDITLHVSATNSAIFLYHGFGFKIEEYIHDFYDKYLPPDSRECRHAFFYRMSW